MIKLFITALCFVLLQPLGWYAYASTDELTAMLFEDYARHDEACRGGAGDENATWMACGARDYISQLLRTRGFCHGKDGEYAYQMTWHLCEAGSIGWKSYEPLNKPAKR